MSTSTDDNHDSDQPRYPCPCCKYDCENEKCILCSYCSNWFHQECAKLSDKRFEFLGRSASAKYKCKYCSKKNAECFECCKTLDYPSSNNNIFCISCKAMDL